MLDEAAPGWAGRRRVAAPLVLPALLALASVVMAVALLAGALVAIAVSRSAAAVRVAAGRGTVRVGQVVLAALGLGFLPGAVGDLADIVGQSTL